MTTLECISRITHLRKERTKLLCVFGDAPSSIERIILHVKVFWYVYADISVHSNPCPRLCAGVCARECVYALLCKGNTSIPSAQIELHQEAFAVNRDNTSAHPITFYVVY